MSIPVTLTINGEPVDIRASYHVSCTVKLDTACEVRRDVQGVPRALGPAWDRYRVEVSGNTRLPGPLEGVQPGDTVTVGCSAAAPAARVTASGGGTVDFRRPVRHAWSRGLHDGEEMAVGINGSEVTVDQPAHVYAQLEITGMVAEAPGASFDTARGTGSWRLVVLE